MKNNLNLLVKITTPTELIEAIEASDLNSHEKYELYTASENLLDDGMTDILSIIQSTKSRDKKPNYESCDAYGYQAIIQGLETDICNGSLQF